MTRTEADLEAALLAEAPTSVDVDTLLATVVRRAASRRRRRVVGAGFGVAAALVAGVAMPTVLTGVVHRNGTLAKPTTVASVGRRVPTRGSSPGTAW